MHPAVTRVEPRERYTLYLEFDDGSKGMLDVAPYLNFGVFKRLREPAAFSRVSVSFDTIEWAAGVDLDPEFVYRHTRKL